MRVDQTASDGAPIATHRRLKKVVRSKATGQLYRASYPHGWGDGDAIAAAFSQESPRFYFREVERIRRPWWRGGDIWRDTGEIWQPERGTFDVLTGAV